MEEHIEKTAISFYRDFSGHSDKRARAQWKSLSEKKRVGWRSVAVSHLHAMLFRFIKLSSRSIQ